MCRTCGGCSSSSSCLAFKANWYWHVQLSLLYKNTGSKAFGKRVPDFVVDTAIGSLGYGGQFGPQGVIDSIDRFQHQNRAMGHVNL